MCVKILRIQLDYLLEEALGFNVVVFTAGLSCFNLSQNSECFIAVFKLGTTQHCD